MPQILVVTDPAEQDASTVVYRERISTIPTSSPTTFPVGASSSGSAGRS